MRPRGTRAVGLTLVLLVLVAVALLPFRATRSPHLRLSNPTGRASSLADCPATSPDAPLRLLTWNVAHGRALSFHQLFLSRERIARNLSAVAGVLAQTCPDVVALQEIDGPSVWSGYFDQAESLSQKVGFPFWFRGRHGSAPAPVTLDYGTAILSRWPLRQSRSARFDTNFLDNKGYVRSTLVRTGPNHQPIDLVSVHLDFMRASVRKTQVAELVAALESRPYPLILMGDFNCALDEPGCIPTLAEQLELTPLGSHGPGDTFPSPEPNRHLDWILVSKGIEPVSYRVLPDQLSDHRPVLAEVRLSPPADEPVDPP